MRALSALAITCALSGSVVADDWGKDWDGESGLGTPFVDKSLVAFLDANPAAKKTITTDKLDRLLVPGGNICELPDDPDTKGTSTFEISPDKKTLVILSSAKLSKRIAKTLKLAADPETTANIL